MNITVLRAVRKLEMDVDLKQTTRIVNIERDSDELVTMYGTEKDGELYYFVLDQELINMLSTI